MTVVGLLITAVTGSSINWTTIIVAIISALSLMAGSGGIITVWIKSRTNRITPSSASATELKAISEEHRKDREEWRTERQAHAEERTAWQKERREWESDRDGIEERHRKELAELRDSHDSVVAELRREVEELKAIVRGGTRK